MFMLLKPPIITSIFVLFAASLASAQEQPIAVEQCAYADESDLEEVSAGRPPTQLMKAEGVFGCLDIDLVSAKQTYAPRTATTDSLFAEFVNRPKFNAMRRMSDVIDPSLQNFAKSVGRLDILYRPLNRASSKEDLVSWCTATLISPSLLITAHHCIPGFSPTTHKASKAIIWFDYFAQHSTGAKRYDVDPNPIVQNKTLDFAILKLKEASLAERPYVKIGVDHRLSSEDLEDLNQKLYVFHFPLAQPMRISDDEDCSPWPNEPVTGNRLYVHHNCATFAVSSGSMLVNRDFKAAAIHTNGVANALLDAAPSGDEFANRATVLAQIVKQVPPDKMSLLKTLGLDLSAPTGLDKSIETQYVTVRSFEERPVFWVEVDGGRQELGYWSKRGNNSAYWYGNGNLKNVGARGRTSINEFCHIGNFNMTKNWGLPLQEGEFGVFATEDGRPVVIKLIDVEWRESGTESRIEYQYWYPRDKSLGSLSGSSEECNETEFELAKSTNIDSIVRTPEFVLNRKFVAFDYDNYQNGNISFGQGATEFPISISGRSSDSVYFYVGDLAYESAISLENSEFEELLSTQIEQRLNNAGKPSRSISLKIGQTTVVRKSNGWIGAITPRRIISDKSVIVFDLLFGSSSFDGRALAENPFLECTDAGLMAPSCASDRAVPGYVSAL